MKKLVILLSAIAAILLGWKILSKFVEQVEWIGLDFIGRRPFFLVIGIIIAVLNIVHFTTASSNQTLKSLQFRNAIMGIFFLINTIIKSIQYTQNDALSTPLPQFAIISIITLAYILAFYLTFKQVKNLTEFP